MRKLTGLFILISILSVSPVFAQKTVEKYPNGEKKFQGRLDDGLKVGTHTYWFENGEKWKEEKYNDLGGMIRYREWNEAGELIKDEKPEEGLEIIRKQQFETFPWFEKDGIGFYKLKGETHLQQITNHEKLVIHYATYLENGKELDNSFRKRIPLPVDLKSRSLIDGFLRGLRYFEKGDNGYIKVPYELAYGKEGGGDIPGYATIYFHILVIQAQ